MYSTAARAKSTSIVLEAVGEAEEDEDVDDGVVLSDVCEGEGEESKTMPLEVASAGWFALVGDALPHSFLRCFCAFPLKVTRAFSAAQLRSASLNRPRRVWASSFRS